MRILVVEDELKTAHAVRGTPGLDAGADDYLAKPFEVEVGIDGDRARIAVSDSGPGIPEEDRERVFERFWRGDHARATAPQGAGLGLAICREVAAGLDGSIELGRSTSGGCRVEIFLPRLHDSLILEST